MPANKNSTCRYCGSARLTQILSLGDQPPSNSFVRQEAVAREERFPLDVYVCEACALVQLLDVVPAETIFDDYLYLSSSSGALKRHYAALAQQLTERFGLKDGDLVVDIGCNDGILLHGYQRSGLVKLGVEPSQVAKIARDSGLEVERAFFSPAVARRIVGRRGPAAVVTATNVFAHVDDMHAFVEGLEPLLGARGVFVVEASYVLDVIDQTLFDTIYHEHLCYLSLTPMVPFLARHGLEVFDVARVPFGASGPAFRVFVQRRGGPHAVEPSVAACLDAERRWGVAEMDTYRQFASRVERLRAQALDLLADVRRSGARLGGYGAPAKGNTLLNFFQLTADTIPFIAETNALKQGLLTPGSHIPIISEEEFLTRMPECALLLSWNYLEFFLEKSDYIRRGGRFLVPLPAPRLAP